MLGELPSSVIALAVALFVIYILRDHFLGPLLERIVEILVPGKGIKLGVEGLIGQSGKVVAPFEQSAETGQLQGSVRLNGEVWNAILNCKVGEVPPVGCGIKVESVNGLRLTVTPERVE